MYLFLLRQKKGSQFIFLRRIYGNCTRIIADPRLIKRCRIILILNRVAFLSLHFQNAVIVFICYVLKF